MENGACLILDLGAGRLHEPSHSMSHAATQSGIFYINFYSNKERVVVTHIPIKTIP